MSEEYGLQLTKKLNEKRGYPMPLKVGYVDAIKDLREIEESDQPQLNDNQQQVLGWLKEYYKENRPFTTAFGAIRNVASKRWAFIKQNLTEDQQEYVLEAFSRWAHEQEEE